MRMTLDCFWGPLYTLNKTQGSRTGGQEKRVEAQRWIESLEVGGEQGSLSPSWCLIEVGLQSEDISHPSHAGSTVPAKVSVKGSQL